MPDTHLLPRFGRTFRARLARLLLTGLLALGLCAPARARDTLAPVYLYASPITEAFFKANGANYQTLKDRWREYLKSYDKTYRQVSRAQLLGGLKPGVLILGSAVLLDDAERLAIRKFASSGGSLFATWGTGVRDGKGRWVGYGFIEDLMDMKVTGQVRSDDNQRFLNTFGESALTWGAPAGFRFFLGQVAEMPIRVNAPLLAGRYFNWERNPTEKDSNGAIAYTEKADSRRAYLGFSESSWEYDETLQLPNVLDSMMSWLRREVRVYKAAWPDGDLSAQLLEMDSEDKYANAVNFARDLGANRLRGTFYTLTSVAERFKDTVLQLAQTHEIGYHGEVHVGFKGKSAEAQAERLKEMSEGMTRIVGSRALSKVTGFRAPTESWDATTEQLLRRMGVSHHVVDPSASEGRLPYFSQSEPGLSPEDAIVGLPRTQMDDLNYLARKLTIERASQLIALEFDYLHEAGALGVLSVHSQSYAPDGLMAKLTPPYLKRLGEHRSDVWVATGSDIAAWWRARERVQFKPVRGSAKGFTFDVRSPGDVSGVTFFVTHPGVNHPLKAVRPANASSPEPELQRIDALRTAVIFRQALKAGPYAYSLEF